LRSRGQSTYWHALDRARAHHPERQFWDANNGVKNP
jgi:hypothetical protein